jgi:thiol-disulfide isomerase/thioredoxin
MPAAKKVPDLKPKKPTKAAVASKPKSPKPTKMTVASKPKSSPNTQKPTEKTAPKPKKTTLKAKKKERHFESVTAFDAFWKQRDGHVLVFVYSDGCPHCVAMKPEWNAFVNADSADAIEKVSVPYNAFSNSACMRGVHDSGVEVRGVPFVALCQSDGQTLDFDEFLYTRNAAPRSAKMLREFVHVNMP